MTIYIGMGSNLGDRIGYLRRAAGLLETRGVRVVARSAVYETRPVGMESDLAFLNTAVCVETTLTPGDLLATLHDIERELGRYRDGSIHDRTCDLDLLLYDDRQGHRPSLPHPRIRDRRFVLLPLLDLDPDLCDPVTGANYAGDATRLAADPAQLCTRTMATGDW